MKHPKISTNIIIYFLKWIHFRLKKLYLRTLIEVSFFKARLYSKESGKFFSLDYTKFCSIKRSEQGVTKVVSLRKFGSKCVCVRVYVRVNLICFTTLSRIFHPCLPDR